MTPTTRTLDPRPILLLLLVPILSYGSSTAYYGLRSGALLYLVRIPEWSDEAAFGLYAMSSAALLAGAILGGLVGALLGGWGSTILGLAALAVGCATIGVVPDPTIPFLLTSGAKGMLTVGYYSVIADGFRGQRTGLLVAAFALLHASVEIGAALGPTLGGNIGLTYDFVGLFTTSAAVAGTATVLALAVGLAWHLLARRFPEPDARRRRVSAPTHLLAVGMMTLGLPSMFLAYQSSNVTYQIGSEWVSAAGYGTSLFGLVETGVTLTIVALIVFIAVGLHILRVGIQPLVVAGVGALIVAASLAFFLVSGWPTPGSTALPISQIGVGGAAVAGTVLLSVFVLASCVRDLHWRLVAPMMALWSAVLTGMHLALSDVRPSDWLHPSDEISPINWVMPAGLLMLGVLLAISGFVFARFWRSPTTA